MKGNKINLIEPVLLTKLHILELSKTPISNVNDCLKLIALQYNLKLKKVNDFRVCVKILEDSIFKN